MCGIALTLALLRAEPARAQAPVPVFPTLDQTIPHPAPATALRAHFGYGFATGEIDTPGTLGGLDDLVVAAIDEDVTIAGTTFQMMGAAYPFHTNALAPLFLLPNRLVPSNPDPIYPEMRMGYLGVAIANCVGTGAANLAFISAGWRTASFPACTATPVVDELGSIEVFDLAATNPLVIQSILPPNDPGQCAPGATQHFGFAIASGDFNGDGIDDLAVGAPEADGDAGRVYVYFGGPNFLNPALRPWAAIQAPHQRGRFGNALVAEDFNDDGKDELIVGAYQRLAGDGQVYIYDGVTIASLALFQFQRPAATQEIPNPLPSDNSDWFGWTIYCLGDVGSTAGGFDGHPDIGIHAEGTDYPNPGAPESIKDAGALFVYFGHTLPPPGGVIPPNTIVDPLAVVLFAPTNVSVDYGGGPAQNERYGRGAIGVDWKYSDASIHRGVIVTGPDARVGPNQVVHAGRAVFLEAPIQHVGWQNVNAWGSVALIEPVPQANAIFGGWIQKLRYRSDVVGDQFVISARGKDVAGVLGAGQVYSYVAP